MVKGCSVGWDSSQLRAWSPKTIQDPVKFQPPALSDRMEGFLRECNIKPNCRFQGPALVAGLHCRLDFPLLASGDSENETAVSAIYDIPLPVLLGFEAFEHRRTCLGN